MNSENPTQHAICKDPVRGQRSCNPLTHYCKQNELTKLNEDMCYIEQRDRDSRRPFQWRTYHNHPYGCKVQATCYPGQFYWDGYGPGSCNIDKDSIVTRNPGYQLTNLNIHQELPTIPIHIPRIRGYFHADTESNLRFEPTYNKKQCTNTTEKSFNPYRFQLFDHLCYSPQDTRFIIPEDTFNFQFRNAEFYHRAGEDTRQDRRTRYRNGCDWKPKFCPINTSYSQFGY